MTHLDTIELALFFTHDTALADWHHGGMLDRELALYRELNQHMGIRFVTYGRKFEAEFVAQLPEFEVTYNAYGLPARIYEAYLRHWFLWLKKPPNLIKSNQMPGSDIALSAARRLGAKFIARCGYLFSDFIEREYGQDAPQAQQARELEREVFSSADHVVVTTEAIRTRVVEQYGLPGKHVSVVPNFVDTDIFAPRKETISKGPFRIIYVGRQEQQKNLESFLKALEGLDVELTLVGYGSLRKNLERIAADNKLSAEFLGNIPNQDLPHLMNQFDLFVLPSHYEGHPKSLLEAMSCGLPVIGTNVPGIREVIQHRENGFLAEPTIEGLRAAIQEVMVDGELQQRISTGAREYVLENVSLEKIVTLELALLESLL